MARVTEDKFEHGDASTMRESKPVVSVPIPKLKVVKRALTRQFRLATDGSGVVTNGFWLVRMPSAFWPDVVDRGKSNGGMFYLHRPCSMMHGDVVMVGDNAVVPGWKKQLSWLDRKDLVPLQLFCPMLGRPILLPSVFEIENSKGSVASRHDVYRLYGVGLQRSNKTHIRREFLEDVLCLAGVELPLLDSPEFGLAVVPRDDDGQLFGERPIVFRVPRVDPVVDGVIMPFRMSDKGRCIIR